MAPSYYARSAALPGGARAPPLTRLAQGIYDTTVPVSLPEGGGALTAPLYQGQDALIAPVFDREALASKLLELTREIEVLGPDDLKPLLDLLKDPDRDAENVRDALSTLLMDLFRLHESRTAFGLLYELNGQHLVQQVAARLRRYQSRADARDVLQEVFFNIHRYPHRFNAEREDAFRVWTSMIVRNTVLKHLRSRNRGRSEVAIDDLPEPTEEGVRNPLGDVVEAESIEECNRVYVTYLHLYMHFFNQLSPREREAITLVEVHDRSYREAAEQLQIKLENLKMVIFRARRKIHRSMRRVFDGLSPDLRPARSPKPRFNISSSSTVSSANQATRYGTGPILGEVNP